MKQGFETFCDKAYRWGNYPRNLVHILNRSINLMFVQPSFKVRELMVSVLPSDVEHETIKADCGYCTTCTTVTTCTNCTSLTSCTYRTTRQLNELVQEDDLSVLKQELELLLVK
ncbi:MAG: hypothetical protein AAF378_25555 [Cyanobacteria bacterium P01_A01_bin.84]